MERRVQQGVDVVSMAGRHRISPRLLTPPAERTLVVGEGELRLRQELVAVKGLPQTPGAASLSRIQPKKAPVPRLLS